MWSPRLVQVGRGKARFVRAGAHLGARDEAAGASPWPTRAARSGVGVVRAEERLRSPADAVCRVSV
ncbi:hypothetical protein [Streptomyces sp. AcE210]|uniref:hypothetical protein n=1 Tax=Streptomyces sp. AcE210 TaxID=2292703 RepID=UPI0010587EA1|nr:hypothetical protein [Streptomyces sp. AcE210]